MGWRQQSTARTRAGGGEAGGRRGAAVTELRLAYWEDLPADDIAVVLGCSPGAARVRLHRARKRAAAHLDPGIRPYALIPDPIVADERPREQEARA